MHFEFLTLPPWTKYGMQNFSTGDNRRFGGAFVEQAERQKTTDYVMKNQMQTSGTLKIKSS